MNDNDDLLLVACSIRFDSMEQIETYQNGDVYIFHRIDLKNSFIHSFGNIHAHPYARCVHRSRHTLLFTF